jgi:hypothetical protein
MPTHRAIPTRSSSSYGGAQAGRPLDRLSDAGNSEDFEVLEITMPADFETTEVK